MRPPIAVPTDLLTERLHLRRWRKADAKRLLPVLEANAGHLRRWIPAHVAAAAPLPELELRLARFAADFVAGRCWRFVALSRESGRLLGEVSLFPRSAEGRVEFASADRLEIGYWLRVDATGRGYATEAVRALVSLAGALPRMRRVEIRCDADNVDSAAVPRRLGFRLLSPDDPGAQPPEWPAGMVWVRDGRESPGPESFS